MALRNGKPSPGIRGALVAAIVTLGTLPAAPPPQSADLPRFEVASVKPLDPNSGHSMGCRVYGGGRVEISGFHLKALVGTAFRLSYWQVSGGEEWAGKDEYFIEAKPSDEMRSSVKTLKYTLFDIDDPHLREMLQALLIDRFHLKFHREMKTGEIYLLERNGKPFAGRPAPVADADAAPEAAYRASFGSVGYVGGAWSIFSTSMAQLAKFASGFIFHVPVLDRTELSGFYDYREPQPDLEPKYDGDQSASFRDYLKELGLKLERSRGPVETFVIDHAERPSAN